MERQLSNSFLLAFATGVFSFGAATWASLAPDRAPQLPNLERGPAAISPALPQSNEGQFAMLEHLVKVDLSCKKMEGKKAYVVKGGYIQLNGKNCLLPKAFNQIKISNQTNGFQASLFDTGKGQYKTDLIQLIEGENRIRIEYEGSGGIKTELSVLVTSRRI